MAMEYKTVDVKNEEEQNTIKFWGQFGWNLKNSQRVYNKSSHLEDRGGSTYSVTETMDFTKIIFERDKSMPNYAKIVSLEEEYLRIEKFMPKEEPECPSGRYSSIEAFAKANKNLDLRSNQETAPTWILGALGVISVLYGLFSPGGEKILDWILFAGGVVAIIASCIIGSIIRKKVFKGALDNSNKKARAELERKYNGYLKGCEEKLERYRKYNDDKYRMNAIISELEDLI